MFHLATRSLIVINFGRARWAKGALGTQTSRDQNPKTPSAIETRSREASCRLPDRRRAGRLVVRSCK